MSQSVTLHQPSDVPWRHRLRARLAVAAARPLLRLTPGRLRRLCAFLRRGAVPAGYEQALAARTAVVAVSTRCAGQGCLQRSLATALLCRLEGTWPTWCAGVRTRPFRGHAWVEADGRPVDEPYPPGYFTPTVSVPPLERKRQGSRGSQ
ncbi:lasso peptide biosynthesis B2 protein [Streptomyces olivoreticuli]|uniref:lasso peptide biosynthesis B2 protein n=1 Tax=Streptomyces olivoreticuli TaxID=68246 RepID=UPI000E2321F9|nr:lasso peptide biosynthesis B2 protein [Streptomyces olivoreticuli]